MVETDTHVFILEFKVDKSGRVASGGDFNAGYVAFRRRVSQGFERWDVFRGVILCVRPGRFVPLFQNADLDFRSLWFPKERLEKGCRPCPILLHPP